MRKLLFFIVGLLMMVVSPQQSHAQCTNSTCITAEMIAVANHADVRYDPALTHYEFLFLERGNYNEPTLTNVTIFRQEAPDKVGVVQIYPDAFCLMEGYAYGELTREVTLPEPPEYTTVIDRIPILDANGDPVLNEDGDATFTEVPREVQTNVGATYTEFVQYEGCQP